MSRASAPLVGLTGRRARSAVIGAPAGFADGLLDVYMSEYATSVIRAGGLPFHLPMDADPSALLDRMDALMLSGGADVDPELYGESVGPRTTTVEPERDAFELALVRGAAERGMPVLGICRGLQLVNVAFGGSIVQDLPDGVGRSHGSYAYPRAHRRHGVDLAAGSLAARVLGQHVRVNSFHHQAAARVADGLVASGVASDGIIEALEHERLPMLAVQWHPETFGGDPVFDWLVAATRDRTGSTA